MKLLKPQGCLFPGGRGNVKEQTTLVEGQGIGFWTRVRLPSGPLQRKCLKSWKIVDFPKVSGYFCAMNYKLKLCQIYVINVIFCHGFCHDKFLNNPFIAFFCFSLSLSMVEWRYTAFITWGVDHPPIFITSSSLIV